MQRFSQLIFRQINATLATTGGTIAVALCLYGFVQVSLSQRHAASLLMSQAIGVSRSAATEGNVLLIQPALERFIGDWNHTEPLEARVEIELDGTLVAKAGQAQPFRWISSQVIEQVALPSGSVVQIRIALEKGTYWLQVFLEIAAFESLVLILFLFLRRKIGRVVSELSEPLEDTAHWIQSVSRGLPESARKKDSLKPSRISEVESVRSSVETLACEITELEEKLTRTGYDRGRLQMADQVVHDIRSPLSALDMWLTASKSISDEEKDRVRGPIRRIQDIINTLLSLRRLDMLKDEKKTTMSQSTQPVEKAVALSRRIPSLLLPLIEQVISEKRLQYSNRQELKIEGPEPETCYPISSEIEPTSFQRIISNLIDNAVESIHDDGWVIVKLSQGSGQVSIEVSDTGKGMTEEELERVINLSESIGKPGGNGMGLKNARNIVQSWHGDLLIKATLGLGTSIRLDLPQSSVPQGILKSLDLSYVSNVVIVDDDPTIHALWTSRWETLGLFSQVPLSHLFKPANALVNQNSSNTIYLVDYDLGPGEISGIEFIQTHGLSEHAILVTSRDSESKLVKDCLRLGLSRIPKSWVAYLPLTRNTEPRKTSGPAIRQGEDVFTLFTPKGLPTIRSSSEIDV